MEECLQGQRRVEKIQLEGARSGLDDGQKDEHRILRVAPYCRVSTDTKEQKSSYETQIRAYRKYISERPDWVLVDIYADKGISGTSLKKRDRFNEMIQDCKDGKIDMIITKNISRFARNVVDCVATARMLKSLDPPVAVYFEDVGINTVTQTGELLLIVLAAIAQGESEIKSTSVKWGFQKRFEEGIPKISPLYGFHKNGRQLTVKEEEAAVVRLIYQMYAADTFAIGQIKNVLDLNGVPAPRGGRWSVSTIQGILANEKYCGDVIMQKTVTVDMYTHKTIKNDGVRAAMYKVTDYHPAIVTRELWEAAQHRLKTHAKVHRGDPNSWEYWIVPTEGNEEGLPGFSPLRLRKRGAAL